MVDFDGKLVGEYTSPMDSMGAEVGKFLLRDFLIPSWRGKVFPHLKKKHGGIIQGSLDLAHFEGIPILS